MNKYDIDPQVYDHTNVAERPSILMDNYAKKKKYITMIFLWDETKDLILASKYDPLKIGMGEAGIARNRSDVGSNTESPERAAKGKNKKTPEEEAQIMMKTVVDLFYEKEEAAKKKASDNSISTISDSFGNFKEESLSDLMKLHDMYMSNLKFHKENGTLTNERESKLMSKIDNIFDIIEEKQSNHKRRRVTNDNDGSSSVS